MQNRTLTQPDPTIIVIFGASGDLTQRKLIPALHTLACEGLLPTDERYAVIGVARSNLDDQSFRARLRAGVEKYARKNSEHCEVWDTFAQHIHYLRGSYDDPQTYQALGRQLEALEMALDVPVNRLFYLATPPLLYETIVKRIGEAGLHQARGQTRIVVEKPFGHDLASAQALNQTLHSVFDEQQIYRIDHYLGKETVQNLLVFRFANTIFEPVWNRNYVDHVQITVAEAVDVGNRVGYYEQAGVMRDIFQNHLMQLLTLTAMEPPGIFDAKALRDEKVKVLMAIRPIPPHAVRQVSVRGQYRGYRETEGVAPDSETATYAALKLYVDNWRWSGVPFYLRSGKALATKATEIIVQFKAVPHMLFPSENHQMAPNVLGFCIQPDEGVHLRFETKVPGAGMRTRSVDMEFHFAPEFGAHALPEAYERLLLDALHGDASLFARSDEIELSWRLIDSVLTGWTGENAPPLSFYERGSWGPPEADEFIARDGRAWVHACSEHGIVQLT